MTRETEIDSESPEGVPIELQLERLDQSLQSLRNHFEPIKSLGGIEAVLMKLNAMEYCQFTAVLAFVAISLYCNYVRSTGMSIEKHPIWQELERVKQYMRKVGDKVRDVKGLNETPAVLINTEAAERLVRFHTSGNAEALKEAKRTPRKSKLLSGDKQSDKKLKRNKTTNS